MVDPVFSKTRIYKADVRPTEFAADLEQIRDADERGRRRRRKWGWIAVLSVLTGIGAALAVQKNPWAGIALAAGLVGAAFAGVKYVLSGGLVCEGRRAEIPVEALRSLGCDMHPQQRMSVEIDFNDHTIDRCVVDRNYKGGGVTVTDYDQTWLALDGGFLDGTRFRLRIRRQATHKVKQKTKGRTKTKRAIREIVSVALKTPAEPYGDVSACRPMIAAAPPAPGLAFKSIRAAGNVLALNAVSDWQVLGAPDRAADRAASENLATTNRVLGLFLACYDALNRIRVSRRSA